MVSQNSERKIVLVVQQDQLSLDKVTRELEREGHFIRSFLEGREAINAIKAGLRYDLGIVDVVCGDIHGNEILNISKAKKPNTPVIVYTGYQIPNMPLADRQVQKPMNIMAVAREYL